MLTQVNSDESAGDIEAMRRKVVRLESLLRQFRAGGAAVCDAMDGGGGVVQEGEVVADVRQMSICEGELGASGLALSGVQADLHRQLHRSFIEPLIEPKGAFIEP